MIMTYQGLLSDIIIIKMILQLNPDVNAPVHPSLLTPLMMISQLQKEYQAIELYKVLVEHSITSYDTVIIDTDVQDIHGNTALHYATLRENNFIIGFLCSQQECSVSLKNMLNELPIDMLHISK